MNKIIVQSNQTIYDIALQYYGNAEAVFEICKNNPNITNDERALAESGIESVGNSDYYLDYPIAPGLEIIIDSTSRLIRHNVVRDLQNREITTYNL